LFYTLIIDNYIAKLISQTKIQLDWTTLLLPHDAADDGEPAEWSLKKPVLFSSHTIQADVGVLGLLRRDFHAENFYYSIILILQKFFLEFPSRIPKILSKIYIYLNIFKIIYFYLILFRFAFFIFSIVSILIQTKAKR
jgi:hypothetical protein